MDGRVKRPDLDNRRIALDWLDGLSQLNLSILHDCSPQTISLRLKAARKEFPELPWDDRKATQENPEGAVKDYVRMNDGKIGETAIRQGSVIKSSVLRNR